MVLLLISPVHASPSPFSGLTITRIDIKDDQGTPWPKPGQVLPLIVVKTGDRFSGTALREGIATLYLKGMFTDIRVEGFPENDGVRLEYYLSQKTIVDDVVIHGNDAISTGAIRDMLAVIDGRELRDDKLVLLKADLLALYQADGYYDTTVTLSTTPLKEPHRVVLHVDIRESAPTILEDITFTGNTVFRNKELFSAMKSKRGSTLKRDLLMDIDKDELLKKYAAAGYPAAQYGPVSIRFKDNKAYAHIVLSEGPHVVVAFSGNTVFGDKQLSQTLLLWSERDMSDAAVDSSLDKLRALYREKGYVDAVVDIAKSETPDSVNLDFSVHEGPRVTVREILIKGNSAFTAKEIKARMSLRESGWFVSRPFREDLLGRDVDYLRDRYLDAGYLSANVRKSVVRNSERNTVDVQIDIAEGPQTRTGDISFEGNKALPSTDLSSLLTLKQGAPYNERLVDEDRYRILSAYTGKGYLYARVDAEKTAHDASVDIRYRITEDQPVLIGRIILRGNEQTRDGVIMRELLVKPGDFYDYSAILASQQRIYRLGYFRVAKFDPVHPGEREYIKDMLFTVEERPAGAVEFGAGYGDLDRLRGFVEVSHRNLRGSALYSSLRFEESTILKRAIFNFQQPWFLGRKIENTFTLVWSDAKRLNSDPLSGSSSREIFYQTRKTVASFGVQKTYEKLKPSLTYQFENVVNYNVKDEALLTPEDRGRVLVSSIIPALVWDLRDDVFNPRSGALYGIILKEALRELWSEADFTKLTVQAGWFLPVDTSVVALSARAGMAWPFRNTPEVPLHERFYMGGSTTVRGFRQDAIGPSNKEPDGTAIPTGGASMAVLNVEFRLNPGEGLGFVLFTDAGNVWLGQKIDLNDLRASYGAGIRYGTPVGPLRVDYGQKIHKQPGESPGELHFNIGNTF